MDVALPRRPRPLPRARAARGRPGDAGRARPGGAPRKPPGCGVRLTVRVRERRSAPRRGRLLQHRVRDRIPARPLPLLRRPALARRDCRLGRASCACRPGRARGRRARRPRPARDAPDVPPERGRRAPLRRDRSGTSVGGRRAGRPPGAAPLVARRRGSWPRSFSSFGSPGSPAGSCSSPSPPCSRSTRASPGTCASRPRGTSRSPR